MVKLDSLKTDLGLADKGKWFEWEGDAKLLIRSADCKDVQEAINKSGVGARALLGSASDSDKRALRAIYANRVLKGWEGLQDSDGEEIPYSAHMALQFFEMDELQHLYEFVVGKANNQRAFRSATAASYDDLDELESSIDQGAAGNSSSS